MLASVQEGYRPEFFISGAIFVLLLGGAIASFVIGGRTERGAGWYAVGALLLVASLLALLIFGAIAQCSGGATCFE